jgi:hypothetical protein
MKEPNPNRNDGLLNDYAREQKKMLKEKIGTSN